MIDRTIRRLKRYFKEIKKHSQHLGESYANPKLIFIMGCQRSGTSITSDIFNLNKDIKVFNEMKSVITNQDKHKIRLNRDNDLERTFQRYNFPVLLAKPLVESQNCTHYLSRFPNLKVLWLYRHYRDVAKSNIDHFGQNNGFHNLTPIVEGYQDNWRSDKVDEGTRSLIKRFVQEGISNYEAAALMWYVRNQFFFKQNLQEEKRVLLYKYEDIVAKPDYAFDHLYNFMEVDRPKESYESKIYKKAIGRGTQLEIREEIEDICYQLYQKLEETYRSKTGVSNATKP